MDGLSIYIETEKHRLLLDTGQTDAVVKNAEVLGIDLSSETLCTAENVFYKDKDWESSQPFSPR